MAACFFNDGESTYIISNSMSVVNAGFKMRASYYNKYGDSLTYYIHPTGAVLCRTSRRRHQTINNFYRSTVEANDAFKKMNDGLTFQTGKWIKKAVI